MRLRLHLVVPLLLALSFMLLACDTDDDNGGEDPATAMDQPLATATVTESEAAATTPPPDATPSETSTTDTEVTATAGASPAALEEEFDEIVSDVVAIRQLEPLEEVDPEVIDREQLAEQLRESLTAGYGPEQAELDVRLMWMMRLVEDRSLDLYQLQLDLLTEQVLGYYAPESDELYVVSQAGEFDTGEMITASQEVVHALQDQHFDLTRVEPQGLFGDRSRAFNAVVEGDGNLTMVFYAREEFSQEELQEYVQESQQTQSPVFNEAPPYIQASFVFPYNAGVAFVDAIYSQGGYPLVNDALEDPPPSTEYILHPEKFLAEEGDPPIEVENPDYEDALGWDEPRTGVMGEFDILQMLSLNGAASAQEAAAGWGGSSYSLYTSGEGESAVALETRWDTAEDAEEFASALEETMSGFEQDGSVWVGSDRFFAIVTEGEGVQLLTATERSALDQMLSGTQ